MDGVNDDGSIGDLAVTVTEVDGIETRYYEAGTGEPMVLCHGGNWRGASSANTWAPTIPWLTDRFRVLAADRLGCGLTANPPSESEYTYAAEVDHMAGFIRHTCDEPVHLVGQSRGAGLAGRVAAVHPDIVRSLTIVDSQTLSYPSALCGDFDKRRELVMQSIPSVEGTDLPDLGTPANYRRYTENLSYSTEHVTEAFVNTAVAMDRREKSKETKSVMAGPQGKRWSNTLQEAMTDTHRRIMAGELTMPTFVIWGRDDNWATPAQGRALFERFAQWNEHTRFYLVNQAGHFPYREYPSEFAAVLGTFLEAVGSEEPGPGRSPR